MNKECSCGCFDGSQCVDEYDDIIEQLKETRDSINRMIRALEQRKVKDDVINQILNTEYEDEPEEKEKIDKEFVEELLKELGYSRPILYKNYTLPADFKRGYYPYYFKF